MNKKIICISTMFVAILIVLGSLSPSICSKDLETVTIEVNRYYGKKSTPIYTELTYEEAEELKEILTQLNAAIENNDEEAISQYESLLNEKGIFGDEYQEFFSNNAFYEKMDLSKYSTYSKYFKQNSDNISNTLCYFNAIGNGVILFQLELKFWEAMRKAIDNASGIIEALVILLALLPIFVLIFLMTHLIPFRILMPIGMVSLNTGRISSLGLKGFKKIILNNETTNVNISGFTGLTINIGFSGSKPFLFVSGIAIEVKETET
jgi:hypothetical protein